MSGALHAWVGQHSEGSWRAKLVVKELAIFCWPDGRPIRAVTREELRDRTGVSMTTIREGLAEARELARAGKRGGVVVVEQGGGQGWATIYRVPVELCAVEAGCRDCDGLRPDRPERTGRQAPRSGSASDPQPGARRREQGARRREQGARRPTDVDGDGSPTSGGTVSHRESAAALAPDGAAAEPGQQEPASDGEPARIAVPDWRSLVNPDRPPRRPSSAEERAAEEEFKRARARLLTGPGLGERSSA